MAQWTIDQAHSEVKFKVKHLVVATVTGHFTNFQATISNSREDFTDAKVRFEADADSIDTKNAQRDGHLKSADFFDAANHSKITFVSSSVKKLSEEDYRVYGLLTIRGVTKEVELEVTYNGSAKGFGGVDIAAFEIRGKISRQEFGLSWNALTEAGGVVVSDEVKLEVFGEFTKVSNEVPAGAVAEA
jgi:polyisoprenoid-binding protein YceI